MHCIYRIINKINGKTYIGQHKYKKLNDKYMGSGRLIKKAIKKYGIENFKKEILEFNIPTVELANDWEQMYILFERVKGKAEYNIANGGKGSAGHHLHFTEEHRRKLSEARKGKSTSLKGKPKSEEHRRKIGESNKVALKGRHVPEEVRKKISESSKGKHHTEESKRKLSEAHKGLYKGKHWKLIDGKRVWY